MRFMSIGVMLISCLALLSGCAGMSNNTKEKNDMQYAQSQKQECESPTASDRENMNYQAVVQGLDGGRYSLLISVCRQFIFVLPLAYGFSWYVKTAQGNLWLVWCTFLIAEAATVIIGTICMKKKWRQVKRNLIL